MSTSTDNVSESLLERLDANEWEYGQPLPSRRELCAQYGVSPVTLSNAIKILAERGLVQSEPGRGVFVAHPGRDDAAGNGRQSPAGKVIALVGAYVPSQEMMKRQGVDVAANEPIIQGIWAAAHETHSHLLLLSETRERFDFDQVRRQNFDGLILLGGLPQEKLVEIRQSGIPAIHANASILGGPLNFIDYDNAGEIHQMVKIFAQAGHRRIACVVRQTTIPEFLPWLHGNFLAALRDHGLSYGPDGCRWIETSGLPPEDPSEGIAAIDRLMASRHPPTAIFWRGPKVAKAAEAALKARGLKIPGDVSIISVQDWLEQSNFSGFTTPHAALGAELVDHLLRTMQNPRHFVQKLIPVQFADRGTVAPPPSGSFTGVS